LSASCGSFGASVRLDSKRNFKETTMNPHTGEIERFSSEKSIPKGWLELTEDEARELLTLPPVVRIERYIKNHRTDKCKACGCFIGNHSLRRFKECAVNELAQFETERLEAMFAEPVSTPD
jgi:hypothetical protein